MASIVILNKKMNFSILGGFKRCFHHILKTQVQGITSLAEDQIAFNSSGGFVLKNIEVKPKVRYHSVSFRLSFPFLESTIKMNH